MCLDTADCDGQGNTVRRFGFAEDGCMDTVRAGLGLPEWSDSAAAAEVAAASSLDRPGALHLPGGGGGGAGSTGSCVGHGEVLR
jgi:hypothetical protein